MQRIYTAEEFEAVIKGVMEYLFKSFYKDRKVICHPLAQATILPSDPRIVPSDVEKGIEVGWLFLYSMDGRNWTHNPREVVNEALDLDGNFYISDWHFKILFEVEFYMLPHIADILTLKIDELTLIAGYKWKPTELGSLQSYDAEEYFSN